MDNGTTQTELFVQKNLTENQRLLFHAQFQPQRKNPNTALLLAFFALHYAYLGKIGLCILMWALNLTGIGLFWMFIDLFRAKQLARIHNAKLSRQIAFNITGNHGYLTTPLQLLHLVGAPAPNRSIVAV